MTPADCDLRDFPFMPLHVGRFRDSDLVAERSLEEIGAAALLWSASWHQVPAASLPDNDVILTSLVGLGRDLAQFTLIRPGAMHGFIICSDGRFYHPLVAREANTAWASKLKHRWMAECARIRKHNQRHKTAFPTPTYADFAAAGFVPVTLPVTDPSRVTGAGPGDHRDRDRDTVEEEYPSQGSAQVVGIGGGRA